MTAIRKGSTIGNTIGSNAEEITKETSTLWTSAISNTAGATDAALRYSLDIANSTIGRSDFIARPTLIVLDRVPASFFSGSSVTLGLTGTAGSSSSITDKPIGVSLTATPTFIGNNQIMLAVRVARSFIQSSQSAGTFQQSLILSKNTLTANAVLQFGETLVLSGLAEREVGQSSNGVPLLQDIPGLQYLFKSNAGTKMTREIVILLTPRLLVKGNPDDAKTPPTTATFASPEISRHALTATVNNYLVKRLSPQSALSDTLLGIGSAGFMVSPRRGEFDDEEWSRRNRLKSLIDDVRAGLYF
jgi:type II secretory pathway component GspD/PulD (secretin)